MGLVELVFSVLALGLGLVGLRATWVAPERPVPWLAVLLGLLTVVVGAVQSLVTGPLLMEVVLQVHSTGWVFYSPHHEFAQHAAGVRMAAFATTWPAILFLGWIGVSRRWGQALFLGGLAWLGMLLVAVPAVVLAPTWIASRLADLSEEPVVMVGLGSIAAIVALVAQLAGSFGSLLGAGAVAGFVDLRGALRVSWLLPGGCLLLGGLGTPPDVITQWMAAALLGAAWGVGTMVGAGVGRGRAHTASASST